MEDAIVLKTQLETVSIRLEGIEYLTFSQFHT